MTGRAGTVASRRLPPFHVPVTASALYRWLGHLRRQSRKVYSSPSLRKYIIEFLAPWSDVCRQNVLPFHSLQDAVLTCASLGSRIYVARNVTIGPLETNSCMPTLYAVVPHSQNLNVFGPGRLRLCTSTRERAARGRAALFGVPNSSAVKLHNVRVTSTTPEEVRVQLPLAETSSFVSGALIEYSGPDHDRDGRMAGSPAHLKTGVQGLLIWEERGYSDVLLLGDHRTTQIAANVLARFSMLRVSSQTP